MGLADLGYTIGNLFGRYWRIADDLHLPAMSIVIAIVIGALIALGVGALASAIMDYIVERKRYK
jgi:hypothetical protein